MLNLLKKNLSACLVTVFMVTAIFGMVSVYAVGEDVDWYYNTFDNYYNDLPQAASSYAYSNDYLKFTTNFGDLYSRTPSFNGNPGISTIDGNGEAQALKFDFTKGGTQTGVSSGIVKMSFDFSVDCANSDMWQSTFFGMNMSSFYQGGAFLQIHNNTEAQVTMVYPSSTFASYPSFSDGTTVALSENTLYEMDFFIDLNNYKVTWYVNGVKAAMEFDLPSDYRVLNNFSFALGGTVEYLDNIRITSLGNDSFGILDASAYTGYSYVDISFTKTVKPGGTFTLNGNPVSSAEWLGVDKVRLSIASGLPAGTIVVAASGVVDFYGNTITDNEAILTVTNEPEPEYVLYENTFDNYYNDLPQAASSYAYSNDYLKFTTNFGDLYSRTPSFNGNPGISTIDGNGEAQALKFDFTKGGTQTGVSSGIVKMSFDFSVDCANSDMWQSTFFGMNMSSFYQGGAFLQIHNNTEAQVTMVYPSSTFATYPSFSGATVALSENTLYEMDFFIDLNNYKVTWYVNGVKAATEFDLPSDYRVLNNFSFALGGTVEYLDNIKISKVADGSFKILSAQDFAVGDTTLRLQMSELADATTAVPGTGITVTRSDGTPITVSSVATESNNTPDDTIVITIATPTEANRTYTVSFDDTFKNVMGFSLKANKRSVNVIEKEYASYTVSNGILNVAIENPTAAAISPVVVVVQYADAESSRVSAVRLIESFTVNSVSGITSIGAGESATTSADISSLTGNVKIIIFESFDSLKPMVRVK